MLTHPPFEDRLTDQASNLLTRLIAAKSDLIHGRPYPNPDEGIIIRSDRLDRIERLKPIIERAASRLGRRFVAACPAPTSGKGNSKVIISTDFETIRTQEFYEDEWEYDQEKQASMAARSLSRPTFDSPLAEQALTSLEQFFAVPPYAALSDAAMAEEPWIAEPAPSCKNCGQAHVTQRCPEVLAALLSDEAEREKAMRDHFDAEHAADETELDRLLSSAPSDPCAALRTALAGLVAALQNDELLHALVEHILSYPAEPAAPLFESIFQVELETARAALREG